MLLGLIIYFKITYKGAGCGGKTLGDDPIRSRTASPSGNVLQNENQTIFAKIWPKTSRNPLGSISKGAPL